MPEPDGRLTGDEVTVVLDWLRERVPKGGCPVCSHTDIGIAEHIVQLGVFRRGGLSLGGPVYPAVLAICEKCQHLMLFSATSIGLTLPNGDSGSEPVDG